jgi:uncharacterized protein YneF (UPF0154 family)
MMDIVVGVLVSLLGIGVGVLIGIEISNRITDDDR